ncbi:MAG: PEP-CTERM sorting domain-containing protein [Phycisphaeraceae bacterium]|nr:PEP-CTERM sorting domain-containing protein [Phycisphaeraceae bacterium]
MIFVSHRIGRLVVCACSLSLLLALFTAPALAYGDAAPSLPVITCNVSGYTGTWQLAPQWSEFEIDPDTGKYKLKAASEYTGLWGGTTDILINELEFDPDPSVFNNVLIVNNSAVTQTYTISISLPTIFPGPSNLFGDITTQVIDQGADGATIAAVTGSSIYSALIDFVTVRTMQDDPFSVTAPPTGVNNALDSFGPELFAGNVTSSIGIQLRFTLSPGDAAAILSRFDVLAVPEPASLALVSLGLFALSRRRSH